MSRRSIVRASVGAITAGTLARPYIAHAAATTATVWWVQGFAEEEDVSFRKIVADYEKASGNTIDYSIHPVCARAPEDRLDNDQRRGPRPVPEQSV
jgi:multiple sugar transport system substrate-binding protein